MNRYALILAAALLGTVSGAYAQTNGVPDNDWLMKQPVPSSERSAKVPRTDSMQTGSTETGAAASANANFTPPPVGSLDSSYGRP
jgi:hypothetical protein